MDVKHLARGVKATFLARVLNMVASGALIVILTRFLLTPHEYGLLGATLAVLGVAQLFSDLGLAKPGATFVTEYRQKDPRQTPHVLRSAFVYRVLAITAVCGVLVVFSGLISRAIGQPELAPLLAIGVGYIVVHSLFIFPQTLFQGFNQVTYSGLIRAVGAVSRLSLTVALVVLVGGTIGALWGYIAGYGVGAALGVGLLYLKHYRDTDKAETAEPGLKRRILRYSVPLTATRGANVLDKRVDIILLGYFTNPVAVSYYYLAKQISSFLQTPAASLGFTVSPTYGEQKADDETARAARLYETTLEHTLLLYVPSAAGVVLVAEPAIRLIFGEGYVPAVPVLQVFAIFVVLQAVMFITSDALDFLGRARSRAYAKGGTSVANFLLNLVLIPAFGVVGAAVATVITFGVYAVVNVVVIHSELSLAVGRLLRHLAATLGVTAIVAVAVHLVLVTASGVVALVTAVIVGVLVWAGLSVVSGLLDPRQIAGILA